MGFKSSVSISYKEIFDDYDKVSLIELLSNIPSINSLEVISHFNAQLHTLERSTQKQIDFLNIWLGRLPEFIREKIISFLNKQKINEKNDFNFFNNISSLILIENILINHNELERVDDLTPEQEFNLFKAYLYCSQNWIDKQSVVFKGNTISNPNELVEVLLPAQLPYQEILEFKDFRIQFIEAVYFFKFAENNDIFKEYLKLFLEKYELESWDKYLINIVSVYVRKFEYLKIPSITRIPNEYQDIISFLNSLSLDLKNFKISDDFTLLREKPVYKIDENNYIFLNLNFLVDKLFQGIQFEFSKVLIESKAEYKGRVIKNYPDFKSVYGTEFSEIGLFYKVIEYVFEKNNYIHLSGNEIKKHQINNEPDYYIRDNGKIYLFEYKDVLINAKTKHSYNINEIKDEISKKLIQNQNDSPKGVTQLVNVIEKIRNDDFKKIDNYDFQNVIIYPIIVYTDFSFTLSGINYLINRDFWKQLEIRKIKNPHLIKDIVLIDLDLFIKFQDLFRDTSVQNKNLNKKGVGDYPVKDNFTITTKTNSYGKVITFLSNHKPAATQHIFSYCKKIRQQQV